MTDDLKGFWNDKNDTGSKSTKVKAYKKLSKSSKKKRRRKYRTQYGPTDKFYKSKEWRELRYMVLKHYGGACMLCGRTKRFHNVIIHVDHIKPRARFPSLALKFDNLQVLCEDCNMGKMTQDDDWRPPTKEEAEENLDDAYLLSLQGVHI